MKKYLASDLDGTLLYPKMKNCYVSDKNKRAINHLNNNLLIVSGRGVDFIKNVCKELNINETFVACNGSIIYLNGKEIFKTYIDTITVNTLINYIKTNFKNYCILLFDNNCNLYTISDHIKDIEKNEKNNNLKFPKLGYITNKDENIINKLLNRKNTFIKMNISLEVKDRVTFFDYLKNNKIELEAIPCRNSIEITPLNINKGTSLLKLTQTMKINNNDVYVIGDDNNDSSMFKYFRNSFLISNSYNKNLHDKVFKVIDEFNNIYDYLKED